MKVTIQPGGEWIVRSASPSRDGRRRLHMGMFPYGHVSTWNISRWTCFHMHELPYSQKKRPGRRTGPQAGARAVQLKRELRSNLEGAVERRPNPGTSQKYWGLATVRMICPKLGSAILPTASV